MKNSNRNMCITAVSSGGVVSSFRLNLTVQTLVGSFPGVIVPIPLHTVNITGNLKTEEQFNDTYQGKPEITKKCNQMK